MIHLKPEELECLARVDKKATACFSPRWGEKKKEGGKREAHNHKKGE